MCSQLLPQLPCVWITPYSCLSFYMLGLHIWFHTTIPRFHTWFLSDFPEDSMEEKSSDILIPQETDGADVAKPSWYEIQKKCWCKPLCQGILCWVLWKQSLRQRSAYRWFISEYHTREQESRWGNVTGGTKPTHTRASEVAEAIGMWSHKYPRSLQMRLRPSVRLGHQEGKHLSMVLQWLRMASSSHCLSS